MNEYKVYNITYTIWYYLAVSLFFFCKQHKFLKSVFSLFSLIQSIDDDDDVKRLKVARDFVHHTLENYYY